MSTALRPGTSPLPRLRVAMVRLPNRIITAQPCPGWSRCVGLHTTPEHPLWPDPPEMQQPSQRVVTKTVGQKGRMLCAASDRVTAVRLPMSLQHSVRWSCMCARTRAEGRRHLCLVEPMEPSVCVLRHAFFAVTARHRLTHTPHVNTVNVHGTTR